MDQELISYRYTHLNDLIVVLVLLVDVEATSSKSQKALLFQIASG